MKTNPVCPVCINSAVKRWGHKNGFELYRCPNCTHIFADTRSQQVDYTKPDAFRRHITNNLMDSDERYYRHLCESELPGNHTWVTAQLILQDLIGQRVESEGRWLDVGSGSGYLLAEVQRFGFSAIGVEPGGWGQFASRQKNIRVIQGILGPDTFDKLFDFISATDVLEHQSEPERFLELLRQYLKPQGTIYLSIPFGGSWRARLLKTRWNMVMPPTHCQFFTAQSIRYLASRHGLRVVARRTFNSGGFPGYYRLGLSIGTANRLLNAIGCGDQLLVTLKPLNSGAETKVDNPINSRISTDSSSTDNRGVLRTSFSQIAD